MFIIKLLEKVSSDFNAKQTYGSHDSIFSNYNRLALLENAVINYGGGIKELQQRVDNELLSIMCKNKSDSLEKLLLDLKVYLRDISLHLNN
ncbi:MULTISPECIES: hypothetical protein [Klebsiella]|uniref:hypothetical protein n=1 Tax=Klebsiella TaxID=570 RepID=UPI002730D0A8|nr:MULTISPECIES: hypothetical protein [Klebsiella]MDP1292917.1 hypothetical protein [Klebsiella variicola]MDP1339887.1 hypothetical protein [Klebsiella variicola]